jgi:hypothetical protein
VSQGLTGFRALSSLRDDDVLGLLDKSVPPTRKVRPCSSLSDRRLPGWRDRRTEDAPRGVDRQSESARIGREAMTFRLGLARGGEIRTTQLVMKLPDGGSILSPAINRQRTFCSRA